MELKVKSYIIRFKLYLNNMRALIKATYKDFKYNKKHMALRQIESCEVKFATLRMYCHMLDKGMNNPDFERGHSMQIYREALELLWELKTYYENDTAYMWGEAIIKRFENAQKIGSPMLLNQESKEYTPAEVESYKAFMKSRVSCRNFQKKRISSGVIKDIISLAVDAPNGCCRQTVRFYVTQNQEKINKLIPNIAGITNFTNIQGVVAVCAESSFYSLIDKNLQYVDASLAAENFILGARLHGVYGTMCNFFHASCSQISECKFLLDIPKSQNIVLFIAIGYPVSIPEKPSRRNIESFYKEL